MNSNLLKQPVDKRYLSLEDNLKLLDTIPIPKDSPRDNNIIDLNGRITEIDIQFDSPSRYNNQLTQFVSADWINKFNDSKRIMASMPDLYRAGKSSNQSLLSSLRSDWIISSTVIIYDVNDLHGLPYSNNLSGKIIHYFGSDVVKRIVSERINMLAYHNTQINDVLSTEVGLKFLQILFGTKDNANLIKKTFENLNGNSSDSVTLWTHSQTEHFFERQHDCGIGYKDNKSNIYVRSNGLIGFSRGLNIINADNSQNTGGSK